jgi:hypothetical protein
MEGDRIAEVRGVAHDQNLDPEIAGSTIIQDKLKEFGAEGEKYQKRDSDMRRLTQIEYKNKNKEELTPEDLRFLYEIDEKIEGFGHDKRDTKRVQEIRSTRDIKEDISTVIGYSREEISTTRNEAIKGDAKYHYGGLDLADITSAEGLKLPESVGGSLYLGSLTSAKGLELPKTIGGYLYLGGLTSAEGLKLPESIGGNLYLDDLSLEEKRNLKERYPNLKIF